MPIKARANKGCPFSNNCFFDFFSKLNLSNLLITFFVIRFLNVCYSLLFPESLQAFVRFKTAVKALRLNTFSICQQKIVNFLYFFLKKLYFQKKFVFFGISIDTAR